MLQWLILAALDVATQPNLHIIEFYIPVQEELDFFFFAPHCKANDTEEVQVCLTNLKLVMAKQSRER